MATVYHVLLIRKPELNTLYTLPGKYIYVCLHWLSIFSPNRMKINRMTADPKPGSKHPSAPHPCKHPSVPHGHHSKRGTENKVPAATSDKDPKPPVRPLGISRLPVLAKSLPLQTPSDFTQSHKRWEENSLAVRTIDSKYTTQLYLYGKPIASN